MARIFAIGDIHGALKALEQLMERIVPATNDRFIFTGDYVDGWSQSAGVINWLMQFSRQHDCIFIGGNHDSWCESWLGGGAADPVWLFHGGQATVNSYAAVTDNEKQNHYHFFRQMQGYFIDDANRLFIHAGFTSMHGPEKERDVTDFMWDRTLWETALCLNKNLPASSLFYPRRLKLFHEIYIGHTPTINYGQFEPMQAANVWNVDTGAAFNGKVSAIEINSKQVVQSDVVQQLYPSETGRNR